MLKAFRAWKYGHNNVLPPLDEVVLLLSTSQAPCQLHGQMNCLEATATTTPIDVEVTFDARGISLGSAEMCNHTKSSLPYRSQTSMSLAKIPGSCLLSDLVLPVNFAEPYLDTVTRCRNDVKC